MAGSYTPFGRLRDNRQRFRAILTASHGGEFEPAELRTLNTHHGVSPVQYVRKLKLEAVRESLAASDPYTATIGYIASEFGFRQLGRFSAQYRKTFGELPSVTLRRYRHRLIDQERL